MKRTSGNTRGMLQRLTMGAAALAAALAVIPSSARSAAPQSAPLAEPLAIRSDNGVLEATLILDEGPAQIAGQTVQGVWTYRVGEGGTPNYPGPTLYVKPGDTIRLKYINRLDTQETNLHTHGLHVSPIGNSDNVLLIIPPGATNEYEIKIPSDHAEGLYWYHPHRHGTVNPQVYNGLSGLIVIGSPDGAPRELAGARQRLLALRYFYQENGTLTDAPEPFTPATSLTYTVNNQVNPRIDIAPGETQVFSVANISNNGYFSLRLRGTGGAADQPLVLIAQDGQPFRAPVVYPVGRPLVVPPGNRFSLLVQGPAAGTYELTTDQYNDGFNIFKADTLATVVSSGPAQNARPLPQVLTPRFNYFEPLDRMAVANRRRAVFNIVFQPSGPPQFQINGDIFPNNPVFQPRLNAVEEWELVNITPVEHPFHIHVNDFQVVSLTDPNQPENNVTAPQQWLQDVINLPKALTDAQGNLVTDAQGNAVAPGRVVVRMKLTDFLGSYVYHCHRVDHEDLGMMGLVTIIPETPIFAVGAGRGAAPRVRVHNGLNDSILADFEAFPRRFKGGVQVAVGDVNHDAIMDVIAVPGPGQAPWVRVFSGADKFKTELRSFLAFERGFRGGLNVAAGDMNSDGYDDIIVTPASGGSPRVKVFSGSDGSLLSTFLADKLGGGVSLTTGAFRDGGRISLATGAGEGAPPKVKIYDVDFYGTGGAQALGVEGEAPGTLQFVEKTSVMAYDRRFRGGVNVGAGVINGQNGGFASILTGPRRGGTPLVKTFRVLDNSGHAHAHGNSPTATIEPLASFMPYPTGHRAGVAVAGISTLTGADLVVGPGSGSLPLLKRFRYNPTPKTFSLLDSFLTFPPSFRNGVSISGK